MNEFEYNFDPMTGEPIRKPVPEEAPAEQPADPFAEAAAAAEEFAAEEFVAEASAEEPAADPFANSNPYPTSEQPMYHYAYQPPKPKKEVKPLTMKHLVAGVAISAVIALVLGLVGGFAGARFFGGSAVVPSGTAVIYKTTKLKDENGNNVKEALSVEEVAALVKTSVVEITTEQIVTGSFMQQYISEGAGSGVIITADGYIVTNHHVIDGATNIKVRLSDGTELAAKLIASDSKSDLAVIKVETTNLTPAAFGSSKELQVGETVVAVGNPLGELGGTVTQGIISALERTTTVENVSMSLLQTDTAINPGNSGGGLFNTSGQLIGVVNAKAAGAEIEGLGFAIPIDTADVVIKDLISLGYVSGRVNPGFEYVEINDAMTAMMYRVSELGLYIKSVQKGSDAETAGFQSGDYVVSVDGTKVTTAAEANALVDGKKPGETATFVIKRGGTEQTVTVTLTEYKPAEQKKNDVTAMFPFGQ